jgi:hypothetical protein
LPSCFSQYERIVRVSFSPLHFNKRKELRTSFLRFTFNPESGLTEMSCCRFEFESIRRIRQFGKNIEPKSNSYVGLGCTTVQKVKALKFYDFVFTPIMDGIPRNFFHCDIFLQSAEAVEEGKASTAISNFQKDELIKHWKFYNDENTSLKKNEVLC